MSLQSEIENLKTQSAAKRPAEVSETMKQAMQDLKQQNLESRALGAGDRVNDFTLPNVKGEDINLQNALAKGPVVLNIYRGGWCPYCNIELNALKQ